MAERLFLSTRGPKMSCSRGSKQCRKGVPRERPRPSRLCAGDGVCCLAVCTLHSRTAVVPLRVLRDATRRKQDQAGLSRQQRSPAARSQAEPWERHLEQFHEVAAASGAARLVVHRIKLVFAWCTGCDVARAAPP